MSKDWTESIFNTANRLRSSLIKQKHRGGGLTELEEQTLADLQRECTDYVNARHRLPPVPTPPDAS